MKNQFIPGLIITFLLLNNFLSAQDDIIIRISGDTIKCNIVSVKASKIDFLLYTDGIEVNSHILKADVKDYIWNSKPIPEFEKTTRISLACGPGYRMGNGYGRLPQEYLKDVRNGLNIQLDINHYNENSYGFGGKYSRFNSFSSIDSGLISFPDSSPDSSSYGNFKDDVIISFIGPAYYQRFGYKNKKNYATISIAVGYVTYKNEATYLDTTYSINKHSLGIAGTLGYDFTIYKNWSLGLNLSLMWSGIETKQVLIDKHIYDIDGLDQVAYANFNVGLKYFFQSAKP